MASSHDRFFCSGKEWRPAGSPQDVIAVLMSGGVDSSVAGAMLHHAGRDVVGVTMQIPSGIGPQGPGADLQACCGSGASAVARQLGISHYFVDVRDEFKKFVLEPFRTAYRNGLTPSPCIDCNTYIKFDVVMRLVREALGIERIATGHYARTLESADGAGLYAAADNTKDQSYFLYGIRREALRRIVFPVGEQTKEQTRQTAASLGLDAAGHAESAELCFAGQGDYRAALGDNPDAGPGDVLDLDGNVIGEHKGISRYTIGQREGLGIAGGVPLYIVEIDAQSNAITLGDRATTASTDVRAHKLNVLAPEVLSRGGRFLAKARYRQELAACTLVALDGGHLDVEFDEPQHSVTPGQHLVLYTDSGRIIAGGEITRST